MPVPRNASYLRNPRLYAPFTQSEAEQRARDVIDPGCAAVILGEQCAIVIRRDGQETPIGVGENWTVALGNALYSQRDPTGPRSTP